jgi:hypothetical protein
MLSKIIIALDFILSRLKNQTASQVSVPELRADYGGTIVFTLRPWLKIQNQSMLSLRITCSTTGLESLVKIYKIPHHEKLLKPIISYHHCPKE